MSQQTNNPPLQRVFKIGSTLIVEDASHMNMTSEQVRDVLAFQFPEIASATITTSEQDGQLFVEYKIRPGRKG